MNRLHLLLDSIKFEHSIFALPFAYIGMVLAARGFPSWERIVWITVAMVAVSYTHLTLPTIYSV